MTIAIVVEIFLPTVNGVITSSINLAENLAKLGHKVMFIAPSWYQYKESEINGIPIHYVPSIPTHIYPGIRLISPFSLKIDKTLRDEKVDIVHITGPWLLARSAILSARRRNIPIVHTFHTLIYEDTYLYYGLKSKLLMPVSRALIWYYIGRYVKKSNIMTAPSRHACDTIKEHFPEIPMVHIRNGVDINEFKELAFKKSLAERYDGFNNKSFIFVGRLGEEKSVSILIEAFRLAHLRDNDIRLYLIGDGPGKSAYEKTVKAEGLQDFVIFLGRMDHHELITSGLYHHARALVTASTTENQPITVLEAIGCNTPIIIPDVAGINELLTDNGLSFKADDAQDFAEQLLKLANDDNVYDKCKAGSKRLRNEFDGLKVAAEFEKLYEKASMLKIKS